MLLVRISLTLSRHFSLSFIASGWSSGLPPVSSHSYCMYVVLVVLLLLGTYVGVHRSTSLMSPSLLLQLCPACLVRLTWIVFVMGSRWPYSWYLVGFATILPVNHIYTYTYIYKYICMYVCMYVYDSPVKWSQPENNLCTSRQINITIFQW